MGDENSHFFHIMATTAHKKNFIVSLTNGLAVTDHEQKASLLWNSNKERMGISEYTGIHFELNSLIALVNLPNSLDSHFSTQEIEGN